MSNLEILYLVKLRSVPSLPLPRIEYKFHPERKWMFDFAWVKRKLAVEIEGGSWAQGRHTRGSGFAADCEKYNAAALLGWRVLRFTGEQIESGYALDTTLEAMGIKKPD